MVIQQQTNAPIWGWADAGETVTVTASWGEQATTAADGTGARSLQDALNVPVGIINASWNGTRIESLMSADAQKSHAVTQTYVAERDEWDREHDAEFLSRVSKRPRQSWS